MAATRVRTKEIGDSQIMTIDLADTSVTFGKLALSATNPCIENDGGGLSRVKVDGSTILRGSSGLGVWGVSSQSGDSLVAGGLILDTATNRFRGNDGTVQLSIGGPTFTNTSQSANTGTPTSSEKFFDSNTQFNLPANWLKVGRVIKMTFAGRYALVASQNIQFRAYIGSTQIMDTGLQAGLSSGSLNRNWIIESTVVITATGSSGTFSYGSLCVLPVGISVPFGGGGVAIDTTTSNTISASVTYSANNASNTAYCGLLAVSIF